jgi:outer membrane autotransporter protein
MDFDTERPTALGDASADFNGSGWFSEVNVAYGMQHSGWTVGPVGGLEYASVHHESYTESGAGILDLSVDSDTTDNLKSLLGVQAYRSFKVDNGKYTGSFVVDPSFTLEWAHEFLDRTSDANVSFASIPTVSFDTSGPEKSRDAAHIRAELMGHPVDRDKLRLFVAYDGNLASDYQDHRGTVGVKIKW